MECLAFLVVVGIVALAALVVFSDGFDSGDASLWSATVP